MILGEKKVILWWGLILDHLYMSQGKKEVLFNNTQHILLLHGIGHMAKDYP